MNNIAEVSDVNVELQLSFVENTVNVIPCLTEKTEKNLRFELSVLRTGPSGKSQSAQSGRFNRGEKTCSHVLSLSIGDEDRASFNLKVFDQDKLLVELSRHYP